MHLISHFAVTMGDLCPTHATLTMHLDLKAPPYSAYHLRVPRPLEDAVQQHFQELWGTPPPKPDFDNLFIEGWAEDKPEDAIPTDDVKRYILNDYKAATDIYNYRHRAYVDEMHYHMDS